MTDTLYALRGRLDDGPIVGTDRLPVPGVEFVQADADKFVEHYALVEVRDQASGRVVYRATRAPIVLGIKPRR